MAAALTGKVTDPRVLGLEYPNIVLPEVYETDDSMVIQPSKDQIVAVFRGPNIGEPPKNSPMPEQLAAKEK
ncbi:MAG: aconitate hydratase [Firmicutes bacterium]|nr:aconitate hydratase [Bacillota bacterium]